MPGEGYAEREVSSGCQEFYSSYYTLEVCVITSCIMYLDICAKFTAGPLLRSQDAHL